MLRISVVLIICLGFLKSINFYFTEHTRLFGLLWLLKNIIIHKHDMVYLAMFFCKSPAIVSGYYKLHLLSFIFLSLDSYCPKFSLVGDAAVAVFSSVQ